MTEGINDLQAFGNFLPSRLTRSPGHFDTQVSREFIEIEIAQELTDRLGTHLGLETTRPMFFDEFAVARFGEQLLFAQWRLARIGYHIGFEIQNPLKLLQ